jgi:hypothetical protein
MPNPWLAIDVATAPATRARELREAWESFIGSPEGFTADARGWSVREPIAASWRRSAAAGVDPSGRRVAPVVADSDEASARWEIHPLAAMAPLIRSCLAATADESRHLIVVSDANGVLLWMEGNATVRMQAADSMNFAEGALWSEGGAGTNAIGTALAARHAVQVFASEHFNEAVQGWTCAAAPVTDPDTGQLVGVIDLTGEMSSVHPHSMAVATATAQAVEAQLRCSMLDRDGRLLARYGDHLSSGVGPRALVSTSGRVIASQPLGWLPAGRLTLPPGGGRIPLHDGGALVAEAIGHEDAYIVRGGEESARGATPRGPLRLSLLSDRPSADLAGRTINLRLRHAEMLTLLCAHPEGLTSDELSLGVYGEGGRAGGIRVEISRLRKLLGDCIDTEPYRLRGGVQSDVAQVCVLLHRGEVGEAAARYAGPILPGSHAPGVRREREALEAWMRQSVMRSSDRDTLWSWLQITSGASDLAAWQRLLADLPFQDPRRSLAAARISALRAEHDLAVALESPV